MSENPFKSVEAQQKLESLSKEVGFDIPVESVPLPSNGLVYSPEHAFHNCQVVEIKCMTAKEEDLLTSSALIKNGTVITKLLQSCMINKLIDPDDLLTGDRNALLIAIRVTGYGPEYTVKIQCPDCSEQHEHTFNLSSLDVKNLGAEPIQPFVNLFEYVLPISKLRVNFKLLTGKEEAEISKENERKKKVVKSQIDSMVTSRLFYSVVSINGEQDRNKLLKIITNLRAGDARALRNYIQSIEPGIKMSQLFTCPGCNAESEVDIPLAVRLFLSRHQVRNTLLTN